MSTCTGVIVRDHSHDGQKVPAYLHGQCVWCAKQKTTSKNVPAPLKWWQPCANRVSYGNGQEVS